MTTRDFSRVLYYEVIRVKSNFLVKDGKVTKVSDAKKKLKGKVKNDGSGEGEGVDTGSES